MQAVDHSHKSIAVADFLASNGTFKHFQCPGFTYSLFTVNDSIAEHDGGFFDVEDRDFLFFAPDEWEKARACIQSDPSILTGQIGTEIDIAHYHCKPGEFTVFGCNIFEILKNNMNAIPNEIDEIAECMSLSDDTFSDNESFGFAAHHTYAKHDAIIDLTGVSPAFIVSRLAEKSLTLH